MKPATETSYRDRIARVMNAIRDDPACTYRLDELAAIANLSRFHFHRVYSAMVGESVIETAQRARLARAALRLAASDAEITDIALDAGYESAQTFARAFRRETGSSPSDFRARRLRFSDVVAGAAMNRTQRGEPAMKTEIIEQPSVTAWAFRHTGPLHEVGKTYAPLWQWQIANGIAGETREAMGVCYGDDEAEDGMRYYAGVLWDKPIPAPGDAKRLEIAGGKYVCHRLVGSHDGIPVAFKKLYGEWFPDSGYEPDDRPALEIYRNNPFDTPENALITDVMIPLRLA
jgi:AraC family transcriptional regulator